MVGGAEIGLEHTLELRSDSTAHQHQRVDREERILAELRDVVATDKSLGLQRLVFRLVLDATERVERRHVPRRLVDAAKQNRNILEFHPGALLNPRDGDFRQISIGAAEIELKFNLQGHVGLSRKTRWMVGFDGRPAEPRFLTVDTVLKTNCQFWRNPCWFTPAWQGIVSS
ncbi:hypothetical protein ACVWZZ_002124 [Bradyrhizobium sp. LM6.10]